MMDKHRPGLLWWWHVLVVMSGIAWGTLIYSVFAGPPRMPYSMYLPAAEANQELMSPFSTQHEYYRGF
jgi:hypothetical protein